MRYYLKKEEIIPGMVLNMSTCLYEDKISENGFLSRRLIKDYVQKDALIDKDKNNNIILGNINLLKNWDTYIDNTFKGRFTAYEDKVFYIDRSLHGPKIHRISQGISIIESYYGYLCSKNSLSKHEAPIIPEVFKIITEAAQAKKLEAQPMKTNKLKDLLRSNNKLTFKFNEDSLKEVTVHPDPEEESKKDTVMRSHPVTIDGVQQYSLPKGHDWFEVNGTHPEWQQDWRYLLSLNWPEVPPIDTLGKYFVKAESIHLATDTKVLVEEINAEGVTNFTIEDKSLKEVGIHAVSSTEPGVDKLKTPKKHTKHYLKKNPANKRILTKEEGYSIYQKKETAYLKVMAARLAFNAAMYEKTKQKRFKPNYINTYRILKSIHFPKIMFMLPETETRAIQEESLRVSNLELRKIARLEKKEIERDNHFGFVCVKDIPAKNIFRIRKTEAIDLIKDNAGVYDYATKEEWKKFKKDTIAGTWNDGLHKDNTGKQSRYTGINRKARRNNSNPKPKGHSTTNVMLTKTPIKGGIAEHKTVVTNTIFIPVWEDHPKYGIRRKRIYYDTGRKNHKDLPIWKYRLAYETEQVSEEVTIPARSIYKNVYSQINEPPVPFVNTYATTKHKILKRNPESEAFIQNKLNRKKNQAEKLKLLLEKLNKIYEKKTVRKDYIPRPNTVIRRRKKHESVSNKSAVNLETT